MNPAVGVYSGPRKSETGLCLEPLLQLQLPCLTMCRRWIMSIFPCHLVHQPTNERDISTALYPISNAVWQQFPLEICHFLPYSHSCSHLKGHTALMECAGSCIHREQEGLWEYPSTHCRLPDHQFQLLCLFSWFFLLQQNAVSKTHSCPSCLHHPLVLCEEDVPVDRWEQGRPMTYPAGINQHSPINTSAFLSLCLLSSSCRSRLHPLKTGKESTPRAISTLPGAGCEREKPIKRRFAVIRKGNNNPPLLLFAIETLQ